MNARANLLAIIATIALGCRTPDTNSVSVIPRFRGQLDTSDARLVRGMNYDPADKPLAWTTRGTIIVAHSERYSLGDVLSGTCAGSGIFAVSESGGSARPLGVGAPVCDAVLQDLGLAIDPSGSWLIYSVRLPPNNSGLIRIDLRTAHADTLSTGCRVYLEHPSVSSDGRFIGAIGLCRDRQQPDWGAYSLRSDGSGLRDLALGVPFWETTPAWSPSGTQLVFAGPTGLVIIDTAGARQPLAAIGRSLSWSPDGHWVAFSSGAAILLVHPSGANLHEVFRNKERGTFNRGWGPMPEGLVAGPIVWSPDSRSLAFPRTFDRGTSIWRLDLESAQASRVTAPDHW